MSLPRRVSTARPGQKSKAAGRKPKSSQGSSIVSAFNWVGAFLFNFLDLTGVICELGLVMFRASVSSIMLLIFFVLLPAGLFIGLMIPVTVLYAGVLCLFTSWVHALIAIVVVPVFFLFLYGFFFEELENKFKSEKIRGSELSESGPDSARKPLAKPARQTTSTRFTPTANRLRRTK